MDLLYKRSSEAIETTQGQLQVSYRVEQAWVSQLQPNQPVVGWVRKVNHGKRPWLFYAAKDRLGNWVRLTESFERLEDLKAWAARICPTCLVKPGLGRQSNLCWDCFKGQS